MSLAMFQVTVFVPIDVKNGASVVNNQNLLELMSIIYHSNLCVSVCTNCCGLWCQVSMTTAFFYAFYYSIKSDTLISPCIIY